VTRVGSKGVVGEGVSVGNGEEVVKDVYKVTICRQFRLFVNNELKMSSGAL